MIEPFAMNAILFCGGIVIGGVVLFFVISAIDWFRSKNDGDKEWME